MNKLFLLALVAAPFFALPVAARPVADTGSTLLSDFEDGQGFNSLYGRWFYFNDAGNGGNSKVTTADLSNGWLDSTSYGPGYGGSKLAVRCGFRFGDKKAGTCDSTACNQWNDAGIGTDLRNYDSVLNLSGATSLTFWAKAALPIKVTFLLGTNNIKDYSFYRQSLNVTTNWTLFTVTFKKSATFAQATWGSPQVALDMSQATTFSWDMVASDNPGLAGDTLYLDDVKINGWVYSNTGIRSGTKSAIGPMQVTRNGNMLRVRVPGEWRNGGAVEVADPAGRRITRVPLRPGEESIEVNLPQSAAKGPLLLRNAR